MSEVYKRMFKSKESASPLTQKTSTSDKYNRVGVQNLQDMGRIKTDKKGKYVVNEELRGSKQDTLRLKNKSLGKVGSLISDSDYSDASDANAWNSKENEYINSKRGARDWNKEKREYHNNKGNIELIPTDDGEKQILKGIKPINMGKNQKTDK